MTELARKHSTRRIHELHKVEDRETNNEISTHLDSMRAQRLVGGDFILNQGRQ